MAIALKALNDLDPDLVAQQTAEMTARIQELNSRLYVRLGVFHDLLISYNGILGAQRQDQINQYLRGRSLLDIEADPTLADDTLVDGVLSNFLVTRLPGAQATGDVTVILSADVTVTIAQGSIWEADGKQFVTPQAFTAKVEEGQVIGSGDRLLAETAEGNWAFTITLEAVEAGADSELRKDTLVVPQVVPPNFLTAVVANDFTGGRDTETNSELLTRLQEGIASKSPSNRITLKAMLRAEEAFAGIAASSTIGYGDPEQLRDKHWIWPIAGGGRVDFYVRTQANLYRQTLEKSAVLTEKTTDGFGVWQVSITRDDAPGFFEVNSIRRAGETEVTGFTITSDTRANDLTGDGFIPDIATVAEGAYTRFQTAVIKFTDTLTATATLEVGDSADYDVEVSGLPLIGEIQDFLSDEDHRHRAADLLVKAPVPCFVRLNFEIDRRSGDTSPDLDAIKLALCAEVNGVPFIGRLYASQLQNVIYDSLHEDQTVSAIDMFGRIRYPDGSTSYLRDSEALLIPDDPANMVTARTVQFFLNPEDIGITVKTAVPALT